MAVPTTSLRKPDPRSALPPRRRRTRSRDGRDAWLLAGRQSIDPALHETAAVDGASAWQRFRHVTLPGLRPVIVAITCLDFIWNLNSFGLVYVLTAGGPGGQTTLPMLFAYNEAFRYGNFGAAAAMGNVLVVLIVALLLVSLRANSRRDR